jgi:sarcosine oxidase gamma subunit
VEVVTSVERFGLVCPCADVVTRHVAELLEGTGLLWAFGKAIVRQRHTSAMFVCVDAGGDAHELWVSAAWVAPGEWTVRHAPLPEG